MINFTILQCCLHEKKNQPYTLTTFAIALIKIAIVGKKKKMKGRRAIKQKMENNVLYSVQI